LTPATQRVWLIDPEHIGVFPLPFSALYSTDNVFAAAAGTLLSVERGDEETLTSMVYAANFLRMCGKESLG
jgi:hypothetical protein